MWQLWCLTLPQNKNTLHDVFDKLTSIGAEPTSLISFWYILICMKKAELFKRYLWLIDVISQSGGISRDEINHRWSRSALNERNETEIPERTFHRHKEAIKELFDINIICDRSTERIYRIYPTDIDKSQNICSWLLNAFSLENTLLDGRQIQDRILVEDIPSGSQFFTNIIEAMRENYTLNITYQNFFNDTPWCFDVEPYCLKLFRQRWYLLARSPYDDKLRIYGLDRIIELSQTNKKFKLPTDFDATTIFENSFGIIIGTNDRPTTIKFKVMNDQQKYIRSLPLHHSQKEILVTPEYSLFSIYVKPTFDLLQEFLKYGANLEILEPDYLRSQITEIIGGMHNLYNSLDPNK